MAIRSQKKPKGDRNVSVIVSVDAFNVSVRITLVNLNVGFVTSN